jgi:oligoendopeptidase F
MRDRLPQTAREFESWTWPEIEPFMRELAERKLSTPNLDEWLADWSQVLSLLEETSTRLRVRSSTDTSDREAERRYLDYEEKVWSPSTASDQKIIGNFTRSKLEPPPGFEIPFRNMKAKSELFRERNMPLLTEEDRLENEYNKILGAQTVEWDGKEITLSRLTGKLGDPDRGVRERAWRLSVERQMEDREKIDKIWARLVALRHEIALNAGLENYRAFHWVDARRFDYTPEDCLRFHEAVLAVAVPAVRRIYEKRRTQMGVDKLRPWDLQADPAGRPPLKPFATAGELEEKASAILHRVDPQLGGHFEFMRKEGLLDLENRRNKAPHAWCTSYPLERKPFIFMNATGRERDVITLLHEAGHAFHVFEMAKLPYYHQMEVPSEFDEVASMSMELLASPYLAAREGGFYSGQDAARARVEHLEHAIIVSWPYCTVMDAFQHWVYANPDVSADPRVCGKKWSEMWLRFMPVVDWSGLEEALETRWQYVPHLFGWAFYAIEYAVARLGSVQVWRNALEDRARAVSQYRKALSLGCTVGLRELYETAGGRLAFDAESLGEAVRTLEKMMADLELET